jgi:dipeptidyl aminopeptidase/acylaminoacyl peptidase
MFLGLPPSSPRIALSLAFAAALVAASPAARGQAAQPTAAAPPAVAVEPFFRHPDYRSLKLSPSGRYVGGLVPVKGRVALAVLDLDKKTSQVIAGVEDHDIATFEWVSEGRLAFSVMDFQAGLGEQRGGGLFAVNRDGGDYRVLAPTALSQQRSGRMVYRYTALMSVLRDGSDDVLVLANDNNERYPDVYRMDTRTGRRTLKSLDKPGDVVSWVADRSGAVRAAVSNEGGTATRVWWRPAETAKWELLGEFGLRGESIVPVGFDGDGTLIVAANRGRDTLALYRWDAAKREPGELLAAHPQADLTGGLLFDRRKNRIVGVAYDGMRPGVAWFDDDWARLQAAVDGALPNRMNMLSRGTEADRVLVFSFSDTDPGSYHLLDPAARKLEFVAASHRDVKSDAMPTRQPLRYKARDGLEIPAYLTLPKGREAKNLPLILYVHGGPWIRGASWQWRDEAAYLATLGYAVLEPEFRGSTGWGRRLFEAGWKQWGLAMQDDLDDGMDFLAGQGTIDPGRACIVGASYGGYAVMMGLARNPERWRCGVNYVGVTDINLMYDVTWSDSFNSDFIRSSAKELIGDQDRDAAQLKATSPLEQAAKIRAPVLMVYGGQDYRVPLVHGERMRDALKKNGTPVEWVVYSDEGHGFLVESTRFDFYRRVATFLGAHLGPPPK